MDTERKCCICGSTIGVEETVLTDVQNNHREILSCEHCFNAGRVFNPEKEQLLEKARIGLKRSLIDTQIIDVLDAGLSFDGTHHKQYALWRIAAILQLTHLFSNIEDHGIAP